MIALPAGVPASGFSEQIRLRRREYQDAVERALEDGKISRKEKHDLDEAREALGLSELEAADILRKASHHLDHCPHCGKALTEQHMDQS